MNVKHRIVALVGGGLLAAGLALGTAGAASASVPNYDDGHGGHRNDKCSVRLDERGDRLKVEIRSDSNNDRARVKADFNQGRDDTNRVQLDRRGNGDTTFRIPDRADWAKVTVRIDDGNRGRHHDVTCSDTIRVNKGHGGHGGHR